MQPYWITAALDSQTLSCNLGQMLSRMLMDKEPLNKRQLLLLALFFLIYYPDLNTFPQPDWIKLLIDWDHVSSSLQNQWRETLECSSLRIQGLLLNPNSKFEICCLSGCFWTSWLNSQLMVYEPLWQVSTISPLHRVGVDRAKCLLWPEALTTGQENQKLVFWEGAGIDAYVQEKD